jgi:hypothetical protein
VRFGGTNTRAPTGISPERNVQNRGAKASPKGSPDIAEAIIMPDEKTKPTNDNERETRPAGLEAPPPPELDPTKKTDATHDPSATDPGNGAD